jgi:DNA (cytosine-5)-methyltransferase 1
MILKVGTDCSGIEAPIQALSSLCKKYSKKGQQITIDHKFSSDIDPYCRQSILANYSPEILYQDMKKRNYNELPRLDVYVCGFPCQPFSSSGLRKGTEDSRAKIFPYVVKTIKKTIPTIFILENVAGIITIHNGTYFKYIIDSLESIRYACSEQSSVLNNTNGLNGQRCYNVYYKVLDTKEYGIPQNRKRVFIVGILKSKEQTEFCFPKPIKCRSIMTYIDKSVTHKESYNKTYSNKKKLFKDATFANIGTIHPDQKASLGPKYSSTLVSSSDLWCIPMHRRATIKECLSLQGFPKDFKQVVSDTQMKRQIGNSMSVNVLVHLFESCFKSVGLL